MLRDGLTLAEATARITSRWPLGVSLLPATNDEVETHVVLGDGTSMHFQEWWTRHRAALAATAFVQRNVSSSLPAPGVLDAIALRRCGAARPVQPGRLDRDRSRHPRDPRRRASDVGARRGCLAHHRRFRRARHGDACLTAIGVETSAAAVAGHYGARTSGGLLDAWLIGEEDAALAPEIEAAGIRAPVVPLWMRDVPTSAALRGGGAGRRDVDSKHIWLCAWLWVVSSSLKAAQ